MNFREFFFELNRQEPFHWQTRLAGQVVAGQWPDALALPTASGKTACVDIAVFAMAHQAGRNRNVRTAPRRVFFVVDRRVIVDEVYERMIRIAATLRDARNGILKEVADALRRLAGTKEDADPIIAHQMRGGVYRDHAWVRNPAQPSLIASTVDQVGSRLLFQGYGVSASTRSIHAALIANDALIVLDEAHCSVPFGQTLEWVKKYRMTGGVAESLRMPFHIVEMSATPAMDEGKIVFPLPIEDREDGFLGKRLKASKPAALVQVKQPGRGALEEELFRQAVELTEADCRLKNIVVFVNRVASARAVFERLSSDGRAAVLMIGRMRPIDRDELTQRYKDRLKSGAAAPGAETEPLFVVATQCLEVGADYDFDALVTECASIDALRQRFGRLNRLGREDIHARAVILVPAGKLQGDPVYGDAIHETWRWLKTLPGVDFANVGDGSIGDAILAAGGTLASLGVEKKNAPVLFREYLDIWSQTNPAPEPSPDPGYFLHGPDYESNDVHVVWRADLGELSDWVEIVSLCPPSSAEAMPVSLRAFRKWLTSRKVDETEADIAQPVAEEKRRGSASSDCPFLVWRGPRNKGTKILTFAKDVRPGDTVILPVSYGGWNELGFIPGVTSVGDRVDRAEEAFLHAKRRSLVRVHPELTRHWPNASSKELLLKAVASGEKSELQEALRQYLGEIDKGNWLQKAIQPLLKKSPDIVDYPASAGYLLRSRANAQIEEDDGDDDLSSADRRISLQDHTSHVLEWAKAFVSGLELDEFATAFESAALIHDWGKADERFQALLLGGDRMAASFSPKLWAKSGQIALSKKERQRQRELSGIPERFRHEFLSLQLVESRKYAAFEGDKDLVLHLVAAHHGWARPFALVVIDEEGAGVNLATAGVDLSWSNEERKQMTPPHRVGSGVPDRFWRLTRRFGWWGLAYVETVFRLADWTASNQGGTEHQAGEKVA